MKAKPAQAPELDQAISLLDNVENQPAVFPIPDLKSTEIQDQISLENGISPPKLWIGKPGILRLNNK